MPDERADDFARLLAQGDAFLHHARAAADVESDPGTDASASVTARLDTQGRVAVVHVRQAWRRHLDVDDFAAAVTEAVRDASMRRLQAWAEKYGDGTARGPADPPQGANGSVLDQTVLDRQDFHRRLQAVTTAGAMSEADRRAALMELLALAEEIEQGIDEVSARLQAALPATNTGRSPGGHVTVTVTGGGELSAVRLDRAWLLDAHEINIGRQVTAAFRAAYEAAAASGIQKLIATSRLGQVQRATQDPLGLARRLHIAD